MQRNLYTNQQKELALSLQLNSSLHVYVCHNTEHLLLLLTQ